MEEENKEKEKPQEKEIKPEEMKDLDRKKLGYSENYRKKYNEKYRKKETPINQSSELNNTITEIEKIEEAAEKEVKKDAGEIIAYAIEPKHIKIIKILAILAVLGIISYLLYANFIAGKDFNYFYDIGSLEDANKPYLTPIARVSDILSENREITGGLVYFDIPVPRGSETITIQSKFNNNFPNKSVMSLGAKDKEEWHYTYKPLYYSSLSELDDLYKIGNIYLLNENLELPPIDRLMQMENISIATNLLLNPVQNKIENYSGETIINTSLRGGHVFYIYTSGNLSLNVKKQDINWYNGTDDLEIYLYGLDETLIANITIPDDGIAGIKSKQTAIIQEGKLEAQNLPEGAYKIVFTDFDGLIREIKINTKKIIAEKVYLADSSAYLLENKKSEIYLETQKNSQLTLLTYHAAGIQNITYLTENKTSIFNFYQEDAPLYLNLTAGQYALALPKNDIILNYPGYFSFSKENYFEPFKQKIIKPEYSIEWLKNNADYFITDYNTPAQNNNWLVSETQFSIKQDNLFIKDNKLSLVFNIPHLSQEENLNCTIPIDWINITVHKPGLLEKWGGKSKSLNIPK
jgi:hypothetical protein